MGDGLTRTEYGWEWRYQRGGAPWLASVQVADGAVHVEDGPADPSARRHEGAGGSQSIEDFLARPAGWTADLPELAAAVRESLTARPRAPVQLDLHRDVVPWLQPSSWSLHGALAGRIPPEPHRDQVLVAYALDARGQVFVGSLGGTGTNVGIVERQALSNLRASPIAQRWSTARSTEGTVVRIALFEGPLAAERIVDPDFLRELGPKLGRPGELGVAVPKRGMLAAAALDDEGEDALVDFARKTFSSARPVEALSPLVYAVRGDRVSDALRGSSRRLR